MNTSNLTNKLQRILCQSRSNLDSHFSGSSMSTISTPTTHSDDDFRQSDCNYPTFSSEEQFEVENRCKSLLALKTPLLRYEHIDYLLRSLELLPQSYTSLDSSRPWLLYWILHSLQVLNHKLNSSLIERCVTLLKLCQSKRGGFAGSALHHSHLAPSYAAVNSIAILASLSSQPHEILQIIDRQGMYNYLLTMKQSNGSFSVTIDGECDTRGTYTALCIATLLNINTPKLIQNTAEWLVKCQTYESGFGGEPFNEAHGGYSFCAISSLVLLDSVYLINFDRLVKWTVHRQLIFEGGFQGRTNKLVDGCYSFWQGVAFAVYDLIIQNQLNLPPHQRNARGKVES